MSKVKKTFYALATAVMATIAMLATTPLAASAKPTGGSDPILQPLGASGGGCTYNYYVNACISFASGTTNPVLGDFYYNHTYSGAAYAGIAICITNTSNCTSLGVYSLTYFGQYGPVRKTVSWPGQAITKVTLMNSSFVTVATYYSPWQYYS